MIRTRRALVKDLDAVNELTFEMHNYLGSLVGISFTMRQLKDEMYQNEKDLTNVYVAEFDGKVVGYMSFSQNIHENEFFGKHYHLYHIAVKQEFRRKGVASKLFKILLRKAKRENVNIVTKTFCLNKDGLKFYRKMGLNPIETVLISNNAKKPEFYNRTL
jgi:ribosomal protein S18 acetylase RimI-like enzyme